MEAWGSGYRRCIEDCRLGNYPEPDWKELGAAVRVTFYPHQQTQIFAERMPAYSTEVMGELLERQQAILAHFRQGKALSSREIFKLLSGSIPERTLRYDLAQLRSKGFLASRGKGRATVWIGRDKLLP